MLGFSALGAIHSSMFDLGFTQWVGSDIVKSAFSMSLEFNGSVRSLISLPVDVCLEGCDDDREPLEISFRCPARK